MKWINKLAFAALLGLIFVTFSSRAMEDQGNAANEGINSARNRFKRSMNLANFDIKKNSKENWIVHNALSNFEEEAQGFNEKKILTLKELTARILLDQPLNFEMLANKLPEELLEYIKHLIIKDQKLLPWLVKKARNGSKSEIDRLELQSLPYKMQKIVSFMIALEKQIPRILRNKNIDLHFTYKKMTALEWAELYENKEMIGLLKSILEKKNDKDIKIFDSINLRAIADFYRSVRFSEHVGIKPVCFVSLYLCLFLFTTFIIVTYR